MVISEEINVEFPLLAPVESKISPSKEQAPVMKKDESKFIKRGVGDIRLRQPMALSVDLGSEGGGGPSSGDEEKPIRAVQPPRSFPTVYSCAVAAVFVALFGIVYLFDEWLPSGLTLEEIKQNPDSFISERAYMDLTNLTKFGVRTAGSFANDELTVKWLDAELKKIATSAHSSKIVDVDIQYATGGFHLGFQYPLTSYYDNLVNVVARLRGSNNSTSALLVNCHFDSVPASPGVSDDGANCAVMIEILRILSAQSTPLAHHIIFLFNGAEENALQTAHGFITRHPWAKSVKAFINLEACGAGGRESLFQNAIHHPWMLQAYASSVPRPHGFVIGEELFQSGAIPSDTDFRIFRDYGNIPGLDFANYRNGYVYHTKFDNLNQISLDTIQHTGDNMLALITNIANSPYLGAAHEHTGNKTVFWDMFGLSMVHYSQTTGAVIGLSTIMLSVYTTVSTLLHLGPGMRRRELCMQGLKALIGPLLGWVMALVWCATVALLLDFFLSSLSWYSQPLLLVPLYGVPTFLFATLGLYLQYRITKLSSLCGEVRVQLYSLGVQLLWTVLLMTLTLMGSRSAYLLQITVFFPSLASFAVLWFARPGYNIRTWLWLEFSALIFPTALAMYHAIPFVSLLVPIMGRVGSGLNSELMMALVVCVLTLLCTSYLAPMVPLLRQPKRVHEVLAFIHLAAVAFALSPFSFPYDGNTPSPTPQRVYIFNVHREIYSNQQTMLYNDSGLWFLNMDRNSPLALMRSIPALSSARYVMNDCDRDLACRLPLYSPRWLDLSRGSLWLPTNIPPSVNPKTSFNLRSKRELSANTFRLEFEMSGPTHLGLILCPYKNVTLEGWSLGAEVLKTATFQDRPFYFVYIGRGYKQIGTQWIFSITLKAPKNHANNLIDINVMGHYLDKAFDASSHLGLDSWIPWSHATTWASIIQTHIF